MADDVFERVDRYIDALFAPVDSILERVLERTQHAAMPQIQVSAGQGKLLYLLARMIGAKRVLELGTLAGYSTIWLARALPADGKVVTLEASEQHAAVAQANFEDAGLRDKIEIIVGPALEALPKLSSRGETFDVVFIDADKDNYPAYLEKCVPMLRPGGLLLGDNVIREGMVLAPGADKWAAGAAEFNRKLASDPRLEAIVLQQIGVKGHDGLAIARVK